MYADYTRLNTRGGLSADSRALCTVVCPVSSSRFVFLGLTIQGVHSSARVHFPCAGNSYVCWSKHGLTSLISCVSGITVLHCLKFSVLTTLVSYFCLFWLMSVTLDRKFKSRPSYWSQAGHGSLACGFSWCHRWARPTTPSCSRTKQNKHLKPLLVSDQDLGLSGEGKCNTESLFPQVPLVRPSHEYSSSLISHLPKTQRLWI